MQLLFTNCIYLFTDNQELSWFRICRHFIVYLMRSFKIKNTYFELVYIWKGRMCKKESFDFIIQYPDSFGLTFLMEFSVSL